MPVRTLVQAAHVKGGGEAGSRGIPAYGSMKRLGNMMDVRERVRWREEERERRGRAFVLGLHFFLISFFPSFFCTLLFVQLLAHTRIACSNFSFTTRSRERSSGSRFGFGFNLRFGLLVVAGEAFIYDELS